MTTPRRVITAAHPTNHRDSNHRPAADRDRRHDVAATGGRRRLVGIVSGIAACAVLGFAAAGDPASATSGDQEVVTTTPGPGVPPGGEGIPCIDPRLPCDRTGDGWGGGGTGGGGTPTTNEPQRVRLKCIGQFVPQNAGGVFVILPEDHNNNDGGVDVNCGVSGSLQRSEVSSEFARVRASGPEQDQFACGSRPQRVRGGGFDRVKIIYDRVGSGAAATFDFKTGICIRGVFVDPFLHPDYQDYTIVL
jgi:hypothetical protein